VNGAPIGLPSLFPFLRWPRPTAQTLRRDAWAGVSVGLVLVPQGLAYATLAGMPPETGLYAALAAAIVGVLWGSSPLLATGPVALTSLLTFASISPLAQPVSEQWVALAIWLAIYSGLIQFLFGVLRLGIVANFVSHPVIVGFVNAAALIIIVSQLPALTGLPLSLDVATIDGVASALSQSPHTVAVTSMIGAATVAALIVQRRFAPRLPGVLIVCIVGIVAGAAIDRATQATAIVGSIPAGLPSLVVPPSLSLDDHRALLPAALIIALLSFAEAMSSARMLARRRGEPWDQNRELIGQGLAKIAAGASGAFPVSGSFSRSALNAYAGAQTGWSAVFSAACVVVCLLLATDYLYYLPRAVLAAVIIVPVAGLLDFAALRTLWKVSRDDGAIAIMTFAATIAAVPNVHWGVLAGFVVSLLAYLYRRSNPRIIEVGPHPDGTLRDRDVHALPPLSATVLAVRMDSAITYITAPLLERFVTERLDARVRTVLLAATPVNDIDATGVDTLRMLHGLLRAKGIELRFAGVKKQVREVLERAGFAQELGDAAFFATDRAAIDALFDRRGGA
jgi:SulP family sulfate permease